MSELTPIALDTIGGLYGTLGDPMIRSLVDRFYDRMDRAPEAKGIRRLHPEDLTQSRNNLYMFLIGRFGGPPLYVQQRGQPMLRSRHAPFVIGNSERNQWMACMDQALNEVILNPETAAVLHDFFSMVADAMRNQAE